MKLRIFCYFFILLISVTVKGQVTLDTLNKKIYLRSVHKLEMEKSELKEKAYEWVAKSYNNSNHVTRINSEDKILAKGAFSTGENYNTFGTSVFVETKVDYTLDLEFKEGRYKIEIMDLILSGGNLPHDISSYLMTKEEYRSEMRAFWDGYDGIGKKASLKRIENDKKFDKDYNAMREYGKSIILQIIAHLDKMDKSLLGYLKTEDGDDDW